MLYIISTYFFYEELITNDFKYLRDMVDTMVYVKIKDKEEFIK